MRRLSTLPTVLLTVLLAATLLSGAGGTVGAASASTPGTGTPYPVPYSFLFGAVTGSATRTLPGANDWRCEPTAAHPRPVVLVHGTFANATDNWQTFAPLLANNGYCVYAVDYGFAGTGPVAGRIGGLTRMQDGAHILKRFVTRVLKSTGAAKVDILGHSQGTIMPQWYLKYLGGAAHVRRYVSLAPLWHGTNVADPSRAFKAVFHRGDESTPLCVACGQFPPGSSFVKAIRAHGVASPGVSYTNIMTRYDELVVPYTSGVEKGMKNYLVQDYCPTDFSEHVQLASDPTAAALVLNALDPAHPRAVPCTVVLPVVGTPVGG